MPRMLKSMPWPKLLTTADGEMNCSWSTLVTPALATSSPVMTVAAIGVRCRSVRRRSAVTTISPNTSASVLFDSLAGADCAAAGRDIAICVAHNADARRIFLYIRFPLWHQHDVDAPAAE